MGSSSSSDTSPVSGPWPHGAEVIALDGRRPGSGICEVHFHLDIIGIRGPAVAHKLPVELGGIGPVITAPVMV